MIFVMLDGAKREPLSVATISTWKSTITAISTKKIVLLFSIRLMLDDVELITTPVP